MRSFAIDAASAGGVRNAFRFALGHVTRARGAKNPLFGTFSIDEGIDANFHRKNFCLRIRCYVVRLVEDLEGCPAHTRLFRLGVT